VSHGDGAGTTIKTGRDQFAQATYETFVSIFDRSDVSLEWATLEGREISEALVDAVEIVDATTVVFTPRDQAPQRRVLTGNPGSQLIHDASVPVIAVPDQTPDQ
jgi:Universal stress protein family.